MRHCFACRSFAKPQSMLAQFCELKEFASVEAWVWMRSRRTTGLHSSVASAHAIREKWCGSSASASR